MKVYIAGPMTNLPDENFPAFNGAEERLRYKGFTCFNPASLGHSDGTKKRPWFMRRDIPALMECEGIALLPCWEASTGARCEVHIALVLEMPFFDAVTGEKIENTNDIAAEVGL